MATVSPPVSLSIRSLRKAYADVVAVAGLDLEVRAGECFGLLGPNGAGKTTTIEICEGLTRADSGEVELLGRRWDRDPSALRQLLGIQLQETQFSDKLTVEETICLFRSFYHRPLSVDQVIAMVQLEEKRNGRVGQLSGGQKQRLAMACALIGNPQFLFLDEPTTGLDPQARRQIWELVEGLKATGHTLLLTTHYMEEAERLCDRIGIMDHGRIIALDTPRALIASLGVEHLVEFAIDGRDLCADTFGALRGVRSVRREGSLFQLHVAQLHEAVPALLQELTRLDCPLTELRTHSASLEDVFVSLTGRHLRDE